MNRDVGHQTVASAAERDVVFVGSPVEARKHPLVPYFRARQVLSQTGTHGCARTRDAIRAGGSRDQARVDIRVACRQIDSLVGGVQWNHVVGADDINIVQPVWRSLELGRQNVIEAKRVGVVDRKPKPIAAAVASTGIIENHGVLDRILICDSNHCICRIGSCALSEGDLYLL